jgi:hypothetical protein
MIIQFLEAALHVLVLCPILQRHLLCKSMRRFCHVGRRALGEGGIAKGNQPFAFDPSLSIPLPTASENSETSALKAGDAGGPFAQLFQGGLLAVLRSCSRAGLLAGMTGKPDPVSSEGGRQGQYNPATQEATSSIEMPSTSSCSLCNDREARQRLLV